MKAEVFYVAGDRRRYRRIASLLRDHVYDDLEIDGREIDARFSDASEPSVREACTDYLRLLKAAVLRIGDFNVLVRNDRETDWTYLGGRYLDGAAALELRHETMDALFPAVAVMDRMVMLPEAITSSLQKHPRTFQWCPKPLDLGGVLLTDFGDESSLREAVVRVGKQLSSEVRKICCRYMTVHHHRQPDLAKIGELLDVSTHYLEGIENEILFASARLSCQILGAPAKLGRRSTVTLEIRNDSEVPLHHVRIRVRGPSDAVATPVSETFDLSESAPARLELELTPRAVPFCPLEVVVDLLANEELMHPFPLPAIVDVARP